MKRFRPRLVAWELTRACNLTCKHCRASSIKEPEKEELSTEKIKEITDEIADIGNILILSGGEPLMRDDIYEIADYADKQGLRVVLATNGTLFTDENVKKLKDVGIQRVSISIDGATAESHDEFRGVDGAFEDVMEGIEVLKRNEMPFQINTTITKKNVDQMEDILTLSQDLGAVALHIFLLVPTGRGEELEDQEITPQRYEEVLNWFYDKQDEVDMEFKATCAPHYYRIMAQKGGEFGEKGLDAKTGGCLGGKAFCFISRTGKVYPCGYLPVEAGDVTENSFKDIWRESEVFNNLRQPDRLKGKCGECEYKLICGGCRARAYSETGGYLEEEPYCIYQP
ncbi:heme b synthase [archaeon SCG-AAA382B04]|nr:heme b synthase [archaeon SCG-AAA382B04]